MKRFYHMALLAVFAIFLSSCGVRLEPVYNADNIPVPSGLQASTVEKTIKIAAANRGWIVADQGKGILRATLHQRTHEAVIDIHYSETSYSIDYVSSVDLLYDGSKIHRNYNKWVRILENDINKELNLAAIRKS